MACIKCGQDAECKVSGLAMLYGESATPERAGVIIFEEQLQALDNVKSLGQKIGQMLRGKRS